MFAIPARAKKPSTKAAKRRWTASQSFPYDRIERKDWKLARSLMNDSSNAAMPASSPAISLSGVNLALGRDAARVHILKDINLHIGRGEAIGLVGPSGSGKTTLLMVLAGLGRADTGRIMVAGSGLRPRNEGAPGRLPGPNVGLRFP